jgi:hypothetical protein
MASYVLRIGLVRTCAVTPPRTGVWIETRPAESYHPTTRVPPARGLD